MNFEETFSIPLEQVKTPVYITDLKLLKQNTQLLQKIQQETGCKILLAQKAFSMFSAYPYIRDDLAGTTASGIFEAKLGREEFGKEVHVFSPAYKEEDFEELLKIADHIVFNSLHQWKKYRDKVLNYPRRISCGLRVNPEYAEVETDLYNPCIPGSRMGELIGHMNEADFEGLEGIHFHTMCEQNSDVLARTLPHLMEKFDLYLKKCKWVNFGGGHHITREDYDVELLKNCIRTIQDKYQVQVYLEPGEAVALNAGWFITEVVDLIENGIQIAILDGSAACHMPDVLEMPYRPHIINSGMPNEKPYTYKLGGNTCLAGDIIGEYSFDHPLQIGEKLVFCDMAIYSMVKNNTFNGIPLPSLALYHEDQTLEIVKEFGYEDFKERLS